MKVLTINYNRAVSPVSAGGAGSLLPRLSAGAGELRGERSMERHTKVPKYGTMEYNTMVANQRNAEAALEKQKAKEMAEKKAERKLEHRFEIIKIPLTIAATLFVEHFGEIVQFVIKLFQV